MFERGSKSAAGVTWRALLRLLACAAGALLAIASGAEVQAAMFPQPRDFAEFLVAQPLVIEGTLVAAQRVLRTPLCTCGVTGLGPYPATDLQIRVSRVLQGTADDSVLAISIVGRPSFSTGPLTSGTRVLAWGFRDCHDGWRLWGYFCVVTADGRVVGPSGSEPGSYLLVGRRASDLTRMSDLDSAMTGRPGLKASASQFNGAGAVALLKLNRIVSRGLAGFTYECDSLGWALGTGNAVPRYLDCTLVPGCDPGIFEGDTLAVPIFSGQTLERQPVEACPNALLVKHGFLVGFGVPLSFINYALRQDAGVVSVRPYIAKE